MRRLTSLLVVAAALLLSTPLVSVHAQAKTIIFANNLLDELKFGLSLADFNNKVHCQGNPIQQEKEDQAKQGYYICKGEATMILGFFPTPYSAGKIEATFVDGSIQSVTICATGSNAMKTFGAEVVIDLQRYGPPSTLPAPSLSSTGDIEKKTYWLLKNRSVVELAESLSPEKVELTWYAPPAPPRS